MKKLGVQVFCLALAVGAGWVAPVETRADDGGRAELAAKDKLLREAEALMSEGKAAEAYALLEPQEFERSGEVRYDYLLGISALDSGKADKATLAFERVLAVNPNYAGARLDMARAYYQLGDLARAKTEFETVLKFDPPEAARAVVQQYLDKIAANEKAKRTQLTGYMEGAVGHDSNVNSGTVASISAASLFPNNPFLAALVGNAQITPTKRSNNYFSLAEGVDISHSLSPSWRVTGGADLRMRSNEVLGVYDSAGMSLRGGMAYASGSNELRLTVSDGQTFTGKTLRTDTLGVSGEWRHTYSASNLTSVVAQFGQSRAYGYQATDTATPKTDVRLEGNLDTVTLGGSWMHMAADGKKTTLVSLFSGNELGVAGRLDGKKRFGGLRLAGQLAFNDKVDGIASLGWMHASYTGANAFIPNNGTRKEDQYDLTLGANWHLDAFWSIKPQLTLSRKNSNLAIYSFDRTDASLTVRRDFR